MADFCKECARLLFGQEMPCDLHGITTVEDWAAGKAVAVICEGCGPIQVDPEGNCVSPDCLQAGKPGHGLPWVGQEVEEPKLGEPHFTGHRLTDRKPNPLQAETAIPHVVCQITGRPIRELRRASDRIEVYGTATPTSDSTMEFVTEAWQVPIACSWFTPETAPGFAGFPKLPDNHTLYVFRAGRIKVPKEGLDWGAKVAKAIFELEQADPVGYAAFKAHNGNPVVYPASDRHLHADPQFMAICNAIMLKQWPQVEAISAYSGGDYGNACCYIVARPVE